MRLIDQMQKYRFLYETCYNKIMGLLETNMEQYNQFLFDEIISIVPNPNDGGETCFYFSPKHKNLTKEKVDKLYEKWRDTK